VAAGSEMITTITNDAWFGADLGALSTLRPGVDARDRERPVSWSDRPIPASAASSIRTARARADADFSAGGGRRLGAVPAIVDVLRRHGDIVAYASVVASRCLACGRADVYK
jgi:hypothetical protein